MPKDIRWFMGLLALVSTGGCAAPLAISPPPTRDPASVQAEEAPLVPRPDLVTDEKVIVQLNRPLEETPMPAGHHNHGGAAEESETRKEDSGTPSAPTPGSQHHHDAAEPPKERR